MYGYEWTERNGIYRLSVNSKIEKEIRPVFKEELDYFGFDKHWKYPETDAPLLWAEGIRRYILNGECVAKASEGGFYSKAKIEIYKEDLTLEPIDIEDLWNENKSIMLGLEKTSIDFIRRVYREYSEKGMAFVVAFSGGKDSLALLDLAAKALSPEQFSVVFSNTGMELSTTIQSVERAKKRWPSLKFYEAKSHLSPDESWDEFGPPGRKMRWCCSVHKSVPTILLMREITGNYNIKAVVFDGVRAAESATRSIREEVNEGGKNINQTNCCPILKWNEAELYVYLLHYNILLNDAYKTGCNRVGCTICPLSSGWKDSLTNHFYHEEIANLLHKVEEYTENAGIRPNQRKSYIEKNGWRTRMGGKFLKNGGNRLIETIENDKIKFAFSIHKQDWLDVAPILGPIVEFKDGKGSQIIGGRIYHFSIDTEKAYSVSYFPYKFMDRYLISHLRGLARKTAYCIGCKACSVQCPTGAFYIDNFGKIHIRTEKCVHCLNCINAIEKSCFVAKSLTTAEGGNMILKGMDRYKTFGLRRQFIEHFFEYKTDCFTMGQFGVKQYDSLKTWLRESNLLSAKTGKGDKSGTVTPLFEKIHHLGAGHPIVWAVIWTNLAYNSTICKWYIMNSAICEIYNKAELVFMLGDEYSNNTKDNAVTALFETFRHSPIGSVLKQGIPIQTDSKSFKINRKGWENPDPIAILYALYVWAENTGRYTFTLSQMAEARNNPDTKGVDPVSIFGLNPDNFKNILQEIAIQFDKYLRVTFVADLDNVTLTPEVSSLDVLDLIKG